MDDAILIEVYKQYRTVQDKYTYFLLAVAASCVALCVQRTTGMTLQWSMVLIVIAVICWVVSFWGGCRYMVLAGHAIYLNLQLIIAEKGMHPLTGTDPESIAIAKTETKRILEKGDSSMVRWRRAQFLFLLMGAVFFIAWHITDMALGGSTLPPEC